LYQHNLWKIRALDKDEGPVEEEKGFNWQRVANTDLLYCPQKRYSMGFFSTFEVPKTSTNCFQEYLHNCPAREEMSPKSLKQQIVT
jgi:hypothetical protein